MPRLGDILVAIGATTPEQLRAAIDNKVIFGGRLGTNLLELGAVTEEALARALSQYHRAPVVHGDVAIDPSVLALLRPELVDRLEVVPRRLDGKRLEVLEVLVADPTDLAKLDEVAFATGKQVRPVLVPEARLWALLQRHYGVERQLRGIVLDEDAVARARATGPAPAPGAGPALGAGDLMGEDEFNALYAGEGSLDRRGPEAGRVSSPAPTPIPARASPPRTAAPGPHVPAPPPAASVAPPAPAAPAPARTAAAPPRASAPATPPPFDDLALPGVLAGEWTGPLPLPRPRHAPTPIPSPAPRSAPPAPSLPVAAAPPPPAASAPPAGALEGAMVSNDEILAALQGEATAQRPPPPTAIPVTPPPEPELPPLSFAEAVAALAGVGDRNAIARTVLRFARARFRRAVLLAIHGDVAEGWEGVGEGVSPQVVARLKVRVSQPGVLGTVVRSRAHFLGPLVRTEQNILLLRALGRGAPRNAFAMPVLARGRVVNVLYADAGRGEHVDGSAVGELLILAAKIAQSYEALLARAR